MGGGVGSLGCKGSHINWKLIKCGGLGKGWGH